jgi:hypothetical protein
MPPSVYFSQALFSRRSKNIVIHSKTQDFGWAPHTQKKSFERFAFAISDGILN